MSSHDVFLIQVWIKNNKFILFYFLLRNEYFYSAGCIQLIISCSKDIYSVKKGLYRKCCIPSRILKKSITVFTKY